MAKLSQTQKVLRRKTYRLRVKKSHCKKMKTLRKCKKFKSCKVAQGTKRNYCRKKYNATK